MTDYRTTREERANHERAEKLRLIAALRAGQHPRKYLDVVPRLRAALFIRERYQRLRASGEKWTLPNITARLAGAEGVASGLRIHRYMLPRKVTEITAEVRAKYRYRHEPLKKVADYLALVAAFSHLLGVDPDDEMIAFVEQTGLQDRMASSMGEDAEFDPRLKLADLLRGFAVDAANSFDLAGLYSRAARMGAGWNVDLGPKAVPLRFASQSWFINDSGFGPQWMEDMLPPAPMVPLALIPFGHLEEVTFRIGPPDSLDDIRTAATGAGGDLIVSGNATAWWQLHLSILPNLRGGAMAFLVRTTELSVWLHGGEDQEYWQGMHHVRPHHEGLAALDPKSESHARIDLNGSRQIRLDVESAKRLSRPGLYRKPRRDDAVDETPPGIDDARFVRSVAIGPQAIQDWLLDDLAFPPRRPGEFVVRSPVLEPFEFHEGTTPKTWFIARSLARDLELAVRTGVMKSAIGKWVGSYRTSLKLLEKRWIHGASREDAVQRAQWRKERLDGPAD